LPAFDIHGNAGFRPRQITAAAGIGIIERKHMNAKRLMIIALALSLPACSLLAQNDGPPDGATNRPPGEGRHHRPPPMPLIGALDANHDGVISADEIANAPAALKTLDKNGDGQLTRDEFMPPPPPRHPPQGDAGGPPDGPPPGDGPDQAGQGRPHHPVPPIVAALDTNGDGVISAEEIANASASLLKLDKNGDGQLTRDEFMPPRPQHPPPDGNGQDGPGNGQRPSPPPNEN
jgi:hypothetical protein